MAKRSIPRPRNGGTWTEAKYWGAVREALRKRFAYWKPSASVLERMKVPYVGPNRLRKYHWVCELCGELLERKQVKIDHITPCGPLRCAADMVTFLERLTSEDPLSYQGLCAACHQQKTNEENAERRKL